MQLPPRRRSTSPIGRGRVASPDAIPVRGCSLSCDLTPSPGASRRPLPMGGVDYSARPANNCKRIELLPCKHRLAFVDEGLHRLAVIGGLLRADHALGLVIPGGGGIEHQ